MDLRLVVGGLLTRDAVLGTLLLNYAERLERGRPGPGGDSFIVPSWEDRAPGAPHETRVLTVAAHTCREDPRAGEHLDAVLELVHAVLTGEEARGSITARAHGSSADLQTGVDTVAKVGTWEITLTPSRDAGAPQPRLLALPDLRGHTPLPGSGRRQPLAGPGAEGLPPASGAGGSSR
ncbi:hypothetical protein [Geodermatophilus sp. SYSU D01105]